MLFCDGYKLPGRACSGVKLVARPPAEGARGHHLPLVSHPCLPTCGRFANVVWVCRLGLPGLRLIIRPPQVSLAGVTVCGGGLLGCTWEVRDR